MTTSLKSIAAESAKKRGNLWRGDRVNHRKFGGGNIAGFVANQRGTTLAIVVFDDVPDAQRVPVGSLTLVPDSARLLMFPQSRIVRTIKYGPIVSVAKAA